MTASVGNLTDREAGILGLLVGGATTRQIATQLFLEPVTIRIHIHTILRKLRARTVRRPSTSSPAVKDPRGGDGHRAQPPSGRPFRVEDPGGPAHGPAARPAPHSGPRRRPSAVPVPGHWGTATVAHPLTAPEVTPDQEPLPPRYRPHPRPAHHQ
ncbi:LuxR C-terminal-related transcriptional regulator, partial [Phycicoccus flavus]